MKMTHVEIVLKLIGEIRPAGDASKDPERLENLKQLCELVNVLVGKIDEVSYDYRDRYEASVKTAQQYAENFLTKTLGITE